ncbi:MAG: SDR family oxidoreductase [Chloroflexota bacterium]|nr:SDR family oxidoreductase [Chloroflexota bacterium]
MNELQGKVALVTGGGRGIGRAIALELAQRGCDVAVLARTHGEIEQVAAEIQATGRRSFAISSDLSDGNAIARAFANITKALGPIDILVNNAGVAEPIGSIQMVDADTWAEAVEINLIGMFRWMHSCIPTMLERGWGRIINISTGAATGTGMENGSAYSTSKAGVEMLTLNIAAELQGKGVTVNAVRPGTVDTAMQTHIRSLPVEQVGQPTHARFQGFYEQGKLLEPSQPAHLVANLLQGESTGEIVSIYDQRGQELLKK